MVLKERVTWCWNKIKALIFARQVIYLFDPSPSQFFNPFIAVYSKKNTLYYMTSGVHTYFIIFISCLMLLF